MTDQLVLTEKQDGVCLVTLNRPEALNALSSALRSALCETCPSWRTIRLRRSSSSLALAGLSPSAWI